MHSQLLLVKSIIPSYLIELRYATSKNVFKKPIYPNHAEALLHFEALDALFMASQYFSRRGLNMKIWDAFRPSSVQYKLWEYCPDPRFVADPTLGSNHSRGVAIDLTLVDKNSKDLKMPTDFDDFSAKGATNSLDLSNEQIENRNMLTEGMLAAGFCSIQSEWWHFELPNSSDYPILDINW
jgi:D-alanyl-D-alanine dipeptidase